MGGKWGETPPTQKEELARDRCPSCGGALTFEGERAEGFCAAEGIYVEILPPPQREPTPPPLVRSDVLQATKRDLGALCRAYGLRVSGNKTDLLTRLLRYMDDHGIDLPPEERAEAIPPVGPEVPPASPALAEVAPSAGLPPGIAESAPAPMEDVDDLLELVEQEAATPEPVPAPEEEEALQPVAAPRGALDRSRLRRDRRRFYLGIFLTAIGGPGLALGSILHDALRVPLGGQTYEAFGPLNLLAASIGVFLLLAGLVAIRLGIRGGVIRSKPASGA